MKKQTREEDLYPLVEKWMKHHFSCFKTATDKGLKYSRIDVVGVRDTSGDLSGEVETIAIEVKRGNQPFATTSGQTLGYRVYVNRVYLAEMRDEPFSSEELGIASYLGIGLVQIRGKRCTEILSSPYYQPMEQLNLALLERIAMGKCQICGSFFETGNAEKNQRFLSVQRENLKRAIQQQKGMMFWNYEVGNRKIKYGIRRSEGDAVFERRFICSECLEVFFSKLQFV